MEGEIVNEEMDLTDVLCDVMSILGVELPEDTTEDNLLQNLMRALMQHLKEKMPQEDKTVLDGGTPPPPVTPPAKPPGSTNPIIQEQQPMMMSLEEVEKIADPNIKHALKISLSLQANAFETARAFRDERIARLAKKVKSPAFLEKLATLAKGAQFSLSPDGKVVDSLGTALDVLEAGVVDVPALLALNPSTFAEQAQPKDYAGGMSEEKRKSIVNELAASAGIRDGK